MTADCSMPNNRRCAQGRMGVELQCGAQDDADDGEKVATAEPNDGRTSDGILICGMKNLEEAKKLGLRSPPDARYQGFYMDGLFHGRGTLTTSGGYRYEGDWAKGKPHGSGKTPLEMRLPHKVAAFLSM